MKPIVPFFLFIVAGIILTAGCLDQTNNGMVNATTATTLALTDNASATGLKKAINTTTNIPSELKGSLKVSVSGISYPENLSVILDNETVGIVNPTTPLYLMVPEGTHTVRVCKDSVCKQETVTTRFGNYETVDFSKQLQKDVEFPDPTAQILNYYKNGNVLSVNVEFFNPSTEDLLMSAVVSCRYTYIDDRTLIKIEDTSTDISEQYVPAGQRTTQWLNLYFDGENILNYDKPVIKELTIS
jgi:hypothetical protein